MQGLKIHSMEPGSIADELGLKKGDEILSINGAPVPDVIAYMLLIADEAVMMLVKKARGEGLVEFDIEKDFGEDLGIELEPMKICRCNNKCVFCFVQQMPKGLRRSLYIKDDDYRHSFMYGNYITLTTLSDADYARIIRDRLSPLYVSVHAVDDEVRRMLLGNKKAPPVMECIRRLVDGGITLHTQVVACPGINDGASLARTIEELAAMYPSVMSLAVVPVGLTAHRSALHQMKGYTKAGAARLLDLVEPYRRRFRKEFGEAFVYPSDEFYIKAGREFPKNAEYDGYPQIDNGVGLVRNFMTEFGRQKRRLPKSLGRKMKVILVTGRSFAPYLKQAAEVLNAIEGLSVFVLPVKNKLFGETVTVTGLLSGADIVDALWSRRADVAIIPGVTLRDGAGVFLDDMTPLDIERESGMGILVTMPDAAGLVDAVRALIADTHCSNVR